MKTTHLIPCMCGIGLMLLSGGCSSTTTSSQVMRWEKQGNLGRLSQTARSKKQPPQIRKAALESLARLNWKPSNEERLQVYGLVASRAGSQEAAALARITSAEQFAEIDSEVLQTASYLNAGSGSWTNRDGGRRLYDRLLARNKRAVTISLCQQVVAHPESRTRILLLAIKLGIPGSEEDLNSVLMAYGDVNMAEDYLNCGSEALDAGGRRWAQANGYNIHTGMGSHRSSWGGF
ncbi:hypothetical protein [Prosthecobacter sp.]|uniref:hypothetical protein n=1 Tax=Prosthecobacter sp. TaxID=1965333 RepID=UPI0037851915